MFQRRHIFGVVSYLLGSFECVILDALGFMNDLNLVIHPYFFLWPDVFEEVLEIVSYITTFSPTISLEMWSLWPLMMQALVDWAIDFFPSMKLPVSVFS